MSRIIQIIRISVIAWLASHATLSFADSPPLFETSLDATSIEQPVTQETDLVAAEKTAKVNASASRKNLPKVIHANYEVSKNGQPFARVREQFTITGNRYTVESVTKGLGVYALLGERKLSSAGEVTAQGLRPSHFELHQGDNAKKSLFTDFDWAKKQLQMTVKGSPKTAALVPGTQDLASYAYQFMYLPESDFKAAIQVPVTTGKKLNQYQYKVQGKPTIQVDGKPASTIHLVEADPEKSAGESKELWLGTEQYYVPVRITMTEDGAKLEQVLTELHIE